MANDAPHRGSADPHRVVIVGGGFAGVRAARVLSRDRRVQVTLIDRANHHLFQPLLYQVATGILSPGQIAPALRSLFRRRRRVRVLLGEVIGFEPAGRCVTGISDEDFSVPYDTLIVAAGATHSYFGNDSWAANAPGMKTLDDALHLRSRILGAFELAEQARTDAELDEHLTFVVVGAGPTGVELAGQIAVLAHRILPTEYRTVDTRKAKILLLDATPHVLGTFSPPMRQRAARDLARLGVTVCCDTRVVGVDEHGVDVVSNGQSSRIQARTVVWAAGVSASPLGRKLCESLGLDTREVIDRSGRVRVAEDCSVPGHPNIFVLGDLAGIDGVPGVAQPAMQAGEYVGRLVRKRLSGQPSTTPFVYRDKGSLATIGRTRAVADIGPFHFGGFAAFLVWAVVHIANLVGWGNRFEAMLRWMWTIVARNRRERLVSIASIRAQPTKPGQDSDKPLDRREALDVDSGPGNLPTS